MSHHSGWKTKADIVFKKQFCKTSIQNHHSLCLCPSPLTSLKMKLRSTIARSSFCWFVGTWTVFQ